MIARRAVWYRARLAMVRGAPMADRTKKVAATVPGRYYVDSTCIDCNLCRETAPRNFKRNEDGGYSFVFAQPASPAEETDCRQALEECPVQAIGDDGA